MTFIDLLKSAIARVQEASTQYPSFQHEGVNVIMDYLVLPEHARAGVRSEAAAALLNDAFGVDLVDDCATPLEDLPLLGFLPGGLDMAEHYLRSVLMELEHDRRLAEMLVGLGFLPRPVFDQNRETASRLMVVKDIGLWYTRPLPTEISGVAQPAESVATVLEWAARRYHMYYNDETLFAPDPLIGNDWALELRELVKELARYTSSPQWIEGWKVLDNGSFDISTTSTPGQEDFLEKFRQTQQLLRDQTRPASDVQLATRVLNSYLKGRWSMLSGNPAKFIVASPGQEGVFQM